MSEAGHSLARRIAWTVRRRGVYALSLILIVAGCTGASRRADPGTIETALYHTDFEDADRGRPPPDMFVVDGAFAVRTVDGNGLLELSGEQLGDFVILFGPTGRDNVEVTGRVRAEAAGRRMPRFGLGLGGLRGFQLHVVPAKKQIELRQGRRTLASADYAWSTGEWTRIRLRLLHHGHGNWLVTAKAWPDGHTEPETWLVAHTASSTPARGRPTAFGAPYAGTPIWFDDLTVIAVSRPSAPPLPQP